MMPGMARRVRLAADWTVGLFFGRASAELGQLGHPPVAAGLPGRGAAVGRGARPVSELSFREGRASDLQAVFELGEVAWDASRRARGLHPAGPERAPTRSCVEDWQRERPLIEFLAAQSDGCFLVCEEDDELVGYVLVARFGSMDELAELWVAPAHAGRGVSRGLLERCWPDAADPRARPAGGGGGHAGRPHALHGVRRDAGERALAHAPSRRPVPRAARAGAGHGRAGRARADPGARRGGVEAPRAGGDRPRAARAARVLRPRPATASPPWTRSPATPPRSAG